MRLMCLLCCCDTSDIGAAAPLNRMNDKEIELYQKVLKKEMENRQKQKEGQLASDGAKPNVEVIPGPNQIASQGSKQTMV